MKRLIVFLFLAALSFAQPNNARMLSGVNAQTGTAYPFVPLDATRLTTFANANPVTATLLSGLSPGFGTGTVFSVQNLGPGTLTVSCLGCVIYANDSVGSNLLVLAAGAGADIYGGGINYSAVLGGGSGGGGGGCTTQCLTPPTVGGVQTAGIVVANSSNNNTTPAGPSDINGALRYAAANDAAVVHNSGTETIAGLKTFTQPVTFNSDVNIVGNMNLAATGPLLFSGVKQSGTPTCEAGTDYCLYLDSGSIFRCLLSAGGFCNSLSGTAGGDLTGSFPNPTVAGTNGLQLTANNGLTGTNASKQVINATAHMASQPLNCVAASASGTAYTCTTSPTFTPATNDSVKFIADVANTGAATLNVNSSTAHAITKQGASATALAGNDLLAGQTTTLTLDAAGNWEMQGQLGNAPSGSGAVNNSTFAGCPAYYSATGTTVSCPNGSSNFMAMGNGTSTPLMMFTQYGGGTAHAYTPFGTEALVISSQFPANDVVSVSSCATSGCTPTRVFQIDASGFAHFNTGGIQMGGSTVIQGSASNVSVNLSCGADSNANQACTTTVRGGDVTGNGVFTAGAALVRGGNDNGTGAGAAANGVTIQPGALINATPGTGASEGTIIFNGGVFLTSGTITSGSLACFASSKTITNCGSVAANQGFLGIVNGNAGASYYVQTIGTYVNLPLDGSYTFAAGDFVCPSTTTGGSVTMAVTGGARCLGAQIGIAVNSATASTVTTFLMMTHSGAVSEVAKGTIALHTAAIASTACDVTTTTATGALTTDVLNASANADISGVTGYIPSTSGTLTIYPPWLTSNTVNVKVCNSTSGSITPGAVTLNYQVTR